MTVGNCQSSLVPLNLVHMYSTYINDSLTLELVISGMWFDQDSCLLQCPPLKLYIIKMLTIKIIILWLLILCE